MCNESAPNYLIGRNNSGGIIGANRYVASPYCDDAPYIPAHRIAGASDQDLIDSVEEHQGDDYALELAGRLRAANLKIINMESIIRSCGLTGANKEARRAA